MLQVECESCKAPYQIDERRVPATGLKMRCPKCGHSFLVTNPAAPPIPASPRAPVPSDFPASLGSLDEPDLPVISANLPGAKPVSADLPAAKKSPPRPPAKAAPTVVTPKPAPPAPATESVSFGDLDLDLPSVPPALPVARRGAAKSKPSATGFDLDLPAATADLPSAKRSSDRDLPSIAADLPATAASLPTISVGLPAAASLPTAVDRQAVSARGFGEIDLPSAAESLPVVHPHDPGSQMSTPGSTAEVSFGEIDLPRDPPVVAFSLPPPTASAAVVSSADFGDLELDDKPRSRGRISARPATATMDSNRGGGGMSFGEVDLSSGHAAAPGTEASIGVQALSEPPGELPGPTAAVLSGAPAAATALVRQVERASARDHVPGPTPKRSNRTRVALGVLVAAILVGAALHLTPYGAFGSLYLLDRFHANDYERATFATMRATEQALGVDTYDEARRAIDMAIAAHARTPRATGLTAFAATVDGAVSARFGPDTARASRAKQLLGELPPDDPVKYRDVALAASAAANDEVDKARRALDAASKHDTGDPIQIHVALLRGNVELAANDGAAALLAFKRALELSNDARAHFGLARAYDMLGDPANAKKEIDATLAASPLHPGALTLRARMKPAPIDEAQALKDLAMVLEGPARAKAAPRQLSSAYAARAWVSLDRGSASEARDAFAQAVTLDPRNVAALSGEGRLLLSEGRYTEALARFDTRLQLEPGSPDAIADDAEAKLALERLGEAKKQLTDGRQTFPTSLKILLLLGKVEQHLGNNDAAAADLRAAVAMAAPSQRDAVLAYVALSELLSARGRLAEAKSVLDDARKKLAASATLDRALGEVAELQGEHDLAVAQYRAAIAKDPRDVAAHFRLAVTLRRIRKFDEAGSELDQVAAVDKDYPGLSLERGLLFEESGDVEKAIDQFKTALARAPDDPDLQLRVGSAYVAIGRPDDAIPMLRKVLIGRPTNAEAHHYLGRALMLKGSSQQAEALRYLKRAVDLDPNRAEFHVYVAWAANEATPAQLELARDEIDRAMALDTLNAETYWQRGVLERMQGAFEDAIKDERRALELRPSRYEAHATLAECYEDRNDEAAAMTEWAKAIAGDTEAAGPDSADRHPYWRYKYGKLLMERGNAGAALPLLLSAATTIEKSEQRPGWLAPLEFLSAEALRKTGRKLEAADHFRRFLEIAPVSSPDRAEAQAALGRLTGTR